MGVLSVGTLFRIGHSTRALDELVALARRVRHLIDDRTLIDEPGALDV